ncbi:MAG TPA: nucleoid-associated protein [Pyrinomonadaceae bacterium]|nr:nucleoid-associated protein [Pyrinomonadaceae bacterium]
MIDAVRRGHLRAKLVQVLGSKHAYPITFDPKTASPVPGQVRSFTLTNTTKEGFVGMSQKLALYLFELQHGAISSGLLCAMDVAASSLAGIVLMKLEREEGAQLQLTDHGGKKAFDMSVLDDLILTQGTRLFKTALFLRTGREEDDFRSSACDSQTRVTSSDDMARFWLRFLGSGFTVEPRIATQRFYNSALRFINQVVTDPIQKDELYEHLQSQMKAATRTFSPRSFIENYVPEDYHVGLSEHLKTENALSSFTKDVSDIGSRLRTSAYLTAHGVRVSVPAENSDMVDVSKDQIIVNDSLLSVDRK